MGQTFLKQQQKMQQTFLDIGEEMGVQKCWDYIQTVLRDPEIMGNKTLARPMLEKVYTALSQKADHYKKAFSFDVEADYVQEELDGELREIWGEDLVPFYERYPYVRKFQYNKGRKGWK